MPAPTISPLPTPPSRADDPTNFSNKADAFLGALPTFQTQANAQASYLDGIATAADADAAAAAASAADAATSASVAAGASNYKGVYAAGTTYQIGQSVSYLGSVYIANTVNTGITPVSGANWFLVPNGDVTLTGTQTLTNKTLTSPTINSPSVTAPSMTGAISALGPLGQNVTAVAASAIDCSLGNYFTKTATGALSWTFTNVPASRSFVVMLELTNGGTGTQSWPASVKWPSGAAPTLIASGVDVLGFVTDDGGTTWRGVKLMGDSK
jgi:hypothetical protein